MPADGQRPRAEPLADAAGDPASAAAEGRSAHSPARPPDSGRRSAAPWLGVVAAFELGRLLLAPAFGLMPQDAYYFLYTRELDLSYFDHPPMIGYLLWASSRLLGATEWGVRAGVFTATLLTHVAFYALARRCLGPGQGGRALALFSTTGMATIVSLVATPDAPLLLFWTLVLLALHRAVFGEGRWPWLVAGLLMGLAFLSKYSAVFLQGGLVLFLLASRDHRHRLATPWPWLAIGIAQLVSLPVYVWNVRHGFASFGFQFGERARSLEPDPGGFLGFLVAQTAMLLPVAMVLVILGAARATRDAARHGSRTDSQTLFLLAFFLPVFLTCLGLSVLTWVKVNWPIPAYVAGLLLAAPLARRRGLLAHLAIAVVIHLALAAQILLYPVPVESTDTWFGWEAIAAEAEALAGEHPDAFVFAVDSYKTTAELLFYSDLEVYGRDVLGCPALHLDYLGRDPDALTGRDALLLRSEPRQRPSGETERILERVEAFFASSEELEPIAVDHRGRRARLVRVFRATGYRGPDARREADLLTTEDPCRFAD